MLPTDRDSVLKLAQLRSAFSHKLSLNFIEKILQARGDINFRISVSEEHAGCTALHFAQNMNKIKLLINYGADFTIKNDKDQTVLHQRLQPIELNSVAYDHDWGLIEKLPDTIAAAILSAHVEKSVTTNPGNKDGLTHFHMACMVDHPAAVRMFMENGVPVDQAVGDGSSVFPGCTALHIAVRSCALEVVKVLLKGGADPCAKDRDGMTVIHWLIDNSIKIVDSLIVEKKNIDRASWMSKLEMNQKIIYLLLKSEKISSSMDEIGLSKFHIACSIGNALVAEQFWSRETQIDHRVNADSFLCPGYTALHFAAHFSLKTVHMLIRKGADIMAQSTAGITPFDICLERYNIKDIHLIVSLQPSWQNITLLGRNIRLLDLVSAMEDIGRFRSFLDKHDVYINARIAKDSPVWPGSTPLHLAVILSEQPKNASNYPPAKPSDPNLELIEECLTRRAEVTIKDALGSTPLHLAFRHQRTRAIEKLLRHHHSSANPIDKDNVSHLHIACASGNEDVVNTLLQSGADTDLRVLSHFTFYRRKDDSTWPQVARINAGSTPLHIAVVGTNCQVVRTLVESGANVSVADDNGATPVHCLLVHESKDVGQVMATTLLSADPTQVSVNPAGITHLHVASFFGVDGAVIRLLDRGADINARLGGRSALKDFCERYANDKQASYSQHFDNYTALQSAVERASTSTMKILISRGADLLTKSPRGKSPLNDIIDKKVCLTALARILRENEDLATRVREDYGLTHLHLASCAADLEVVRALIDAGANVNAQLTEKTDDWAGYTPLHVIIEYSRSYTPHANIAFFVSNRFPRDIPQTIRVLLDAGADVNLCDARGNTPLHLIANHLSHEDEFNGELLNMMLNSIKDFRVNPAGKIGMSHFHIACLLNNETAIEKFLQHEVDVNAVIDFHYHYRAGSSALHFLARKALRNVPPLRVETIDALLAHGAQVDAQNADGDTMLHMIAHCARGRVIGRVDIFRSLFGAGADHTKLNILCDTPFATLLRSEEATPQVIWLFIEHGCPVNEFNAADHQGILARPLCVSVGVLADRSRIFDALFDSRDIATLDATGRTAIHNIVSADGFRIFENVSVGEYSNLIARLCNVGCDIDAQDQSGKTALHLATQFKNNKAIAALLTNGADVNVVDAFNNTAFTYGADICTCKSIKGDHRHTNIINIFIIHLRKMNRFDLHINNVNINIMSNFRHRFEANEMVRFREEVDRIRPFTLRIDSVSISLIDMLSETGLVTVYPLNAPIRLLVDQFSRNINVHLQGCTEVIGLFQLQIRKAVRRIELIGPAIESFNEIIAFQFPDTCIRKVFTYLSNCHLENLIRAL